MPAPVKRKPKTTKPKTTTTTTTTDPDAAVKYPKISAKPYIDNNQLGFDLAEKLLGFTDVTDTKGVDYHIRFKVDGVAKRFAFTNNHKNRPFYMANARSLIQEILRKRFVFNGEPIIIGKNGNVLNGQHTLAAVIMAAYEWRENGSAYPQWQAEPAIDKLVVFGVEENDAVVNTLDTCRPRTLADVVYRSELMDGRTAKDRKYLSKKLSSCIKTVWDRTGCSSQYSITRTLTESVDYAYRHPSLLKSCITVMETDANGILDRIIPTGTMAGLHYLMSSSTSDAETYFQRERGGDDCNEERLDMGSWELASNYLNCMATGSTRTTAIAEKLSLIPEATMAERMAVVIKGWNKFCKSKKGSKVTLEDLELEYEADGDGFKHLINHPICGGIDTGIE